jgi:CheY-like chemotaxis protein
MPNRILLADDSITIQKVVHLTFTDEGIDVVTVGNGELAIKKLGEEPFDLVLADIFMPGRNGYEVCEYIKTSREFGELPVLLLVGAFEPFDKAEAGRVRADGHLTKPFESRILVETVKRMLAEAAARRPAPAPEGAYQGRVVGWDVPTSPVPPQSMEPEEDEPLYDPYASTAQLAPMAPSSAYEEEDDDRTMALGSLSSTDDDALAEPEASPEIGAFDASPEAPAWGGASDSETFVEPDEEAHVARAIEGPPDSVAGFSYHDDSEPMSPAEIDGDDRSSAVFAEPQIGYQALHASDSPLDLPDLKLVEPERRVAEGGREPLLETFADVAESTLRVDAEPDPALEANVHADEAPSMSVGPTDGVISAWDPTAQPEAPPAGLEASEADTTTAAAPESPAVDLPARMSGTETQAFSVGEVPFPPVDEEPPSRGSAIEPLDTLPMPLEPLDADALRAKAGIDVEPFDTPPMPLGGFTADAVESETDARSTMDEGPPVDTADLAPATDAGEVAASSHVVGDDDANDTLPALDRDDVFAGADAADAETPSFVDESGVAAEEISDEAHLEALGSVLPEEPAAEAEASSYNGANGATAIPQEVLDEVVRRAVERMSDDVIREIAWEVVPDLAERLIRKRLSEDR